MKTLHAKDFIEFTVLPYIIGFFSLCFMIVGIFNRRILLYISVGLFLAFAILAMADFWRWEYDYGHTLDPNAAIQVPGMSYQPPLLGYKQLLNFGAFSIPDAGGWIFFGIGVVLFAVTIIQIALNKKRNPKLNPALFLLLLPGLSSCSNDPEPLRIGRDNCHFCKMTISDKRFGAEAVTRKGKVYKFDDIQCLLDFNNADAEILKGATFYLVDFGGNHDLHMASESLLLKSEELKSPMNGNIAAFSSAQNLGLASAKYNGAKVEWNELIK